MNAEHMKIQKLAEAHLAQYNELLRYAFQVTEKTLLDYGWENEDIRQSKFPVLRRANVLGYFDGDTLVSQFAVYPLKINVHGKVCDIGFVTSVATYPEYMGLGLMSRLMKQSLEEMREAGQTLSLLYPYSIPLYRHRGWEIVSDKMSFRIADTQLPKKIVVPGYVRRVKEDSPDLVGLHTRFAGMTHGCIFRNPLAWEEYWRWEEEDTNVAIYYSQAGEPLGYMVYLIKEDIMYIKEMIYINTEARKGLWRYVSAHESMIDEVRGSNYFSEPIAFALDDSDIKETIRPYIMGRIIDAAAFLAAYTFAPVNAVETVTFDVTDPFLEWNNDTFTVEIASDGVRLLDTPSPNVVTLDIGTLTTMLMGYKRPAYLAKMERLKADAVTVRLLERVILNEKPYISDYL